MTQLQYWNEMHALKTHINFIELKLQQAETIDRRIKIFLAITSSSSIGGWVIWQEYSIFWAFLIATSQVITAILPHLPYAARIKQYSAVINDLSALMIRAEYKWNVIASGQLTDEQINDARFSVLTAKNKALARHIRSTIPSDDKIHQKAESLSVDYFSLYYPAG